MKTVLPLATVVIFVLLSINAIAVGHYFEIKLDYNNGNFSYKYVAVKPLTAQTRIRNIPGGFSAELLSDNGTLLNTTFFDVPLTILYDIIDNTTGEVNGGGELNLNTSETTIYLPYYENAKELDIYDQNYNLVLSIDLSPYSKSIKQNITAVTTPIQAANLTVPSTTNINKYSNYFYLIIPVFIVLIIVIFILRRRSKQTPEEQQ